MSRARILVGLVCGLVGLNGCASAPEPAPEPAAPAPAAPAPAAPAGPASGAANPTAASAASAPSAAAAPGPAQPPRGDVRADVEMKEVSEKAWWVSIRKKLGDKLAVDPAELRFSPRKQLAVFVRSPPVAPPPSGKPKRARRPPPPRQHKILVVDLEGKSQGTFRPVVVRGSDEPPKDLRFLSETSLIYEVVHPAPTAAEIAASTRRAERSKGRRAGHGQGKKASAEPSKPKLDGPASEKRLFVIQPLTGRRKRPIKCEGTGFAWNNQHDHLAFVSGRPEASFVSVDGVKMYPRKGHTVIASDPTWSKDGISLAFLEARATQPARLVLLAEFDNPTGDTIWDLPATLPLDGVQVFWAGHSKLVVGKSVLKPVFATPFTKEKPIKFDP